MTRYIVRRAIQSVFILLGVMTLTFTLVHLAPGGPDTFAQDPRLPVDYARQYRHDLGLDQPLPVQYAKWVWQVGHLNLGRSYADKRPVTQKVFERIPNTFVLSGTGFVLGFLGVPLGILAAQRRGKPFDHGLRIFTAIGNATPGWWLGIIILLFSARSGLNLFPLAGTTTPGDGSLLDRLHHILLPALLIALGGWLGFSRFMRSEYLEQVAQDYVRTARAKGLSERRVLLRHTLRTSMITYVSLFGLDFGALVAGATLLTEVVFGIHGVGYLTYQSIGNLDLPTIMVTVIYGAFFIVLANAVVDITYAWLDPRIRPA